MVALAEVEVALALACDKRDDAMRIEICLAGQCWRGNGQGEGVEGGVGEKEEGDEGQHSVRPGCLEVVGGAGGDEMRGMQCPGMIPE